MQQYDKQYFLLVLDTIAIHIKQTVRIIYSSIDKINKLQNVQLILHSNTIFLSKIVHNNLFPLGHIWSGGTKKNVKVDQQNSSIMQCSNTGDKERVKHFIFSSK